MTTENVEGQHVGQAVNTAREDAQSPTSDNAEQESPRNATFAFFQPDGDLAVAMRRAPIGGSVSLGRMKGETVGKHFVRRAIVIVS